VFWSLAACVTLAGCNWKYLKVAESHKAEVKKKERPMEIDQKLFLKVPLNSNEPNPCSPQQPDPTWRGILIQAPKQVAFKRGEKVGKYDAFAAIPICGYYLLDVPAEPSDEPMRLVAVDRRTGTVYSGDIVRLSRSPVKPPPPSEPLTAEELEGLAAGGYFNPNLANYVHLPEEPSVYNVHVELREFRSNPVIIEIVEAE
jgi:hypothetical protein